MKIFIYGQAKVGKSEWVDRIGGDECDVIPLSAETIKSFPVVYVHNQICPENLFDEFDLVLKFCKNEVIVEKV